ncbi:hypothetical protein ACOSQ2_032559 [Xanthoceras sorbifolium]
MASQSNFTAGASAANGASTGPQKSQVSLLSSNLNFKLPIKLDEINYTYWKMQVLSAIRAFDLEDYVLNCKGCPEKFVQTQTQGSNEVEQSVNKEFLIWKIVDQLILCWLFSTLSESIFGQVTHCTTTYEMWNTLESLYFQQSKARVLQLKNEMNSTKKGALTINDYILKMKGLSESLTTVGHFMVVDDVILSILGGLEPKYNPVMVTIIVKQGFTSHQEVQFLLMSYENKLA